MFSLTVSEKPVNDLCTHTLYLATSAVNSIPLRRRFAGKRLNESVILPSELTNTANEIVLRIKHVALNFHCDFACKAGVVPGSRIIGKLLSPVTEEDKSKGFTSSDNLLVFPYSTCWIQGDSDPCPNCVEVMAQDVSKYEVHRHRSCTRKWQYGKTINGGLQDYIRVPQPEYSLVKVPDAVSLHDCCFLFDIALPFYSYCKEVLCDLMDKTEDCRILVILNDSMREANDCLLVINHLKLDNLLITFTDMHKMHNVPGLLTTYANKFHHVLVFAHGQGAVTTALALGISTGLETTKDRHTLALFGDHVAHVYAEPPDRTVHRVNLAYKDKFLYEELLESLAEFNRTREDLSAPTIYMQSVDSAETTTNHLSLSENVNLYETSASPAKKMRIRFKDEAEVQTESRKRCHILWLHCDCDFRLCLDDYCDHDSLGLCQATGDINSMMKSKNAMLRVFYTNRPTKHVKINAFIFF